MLCSGWLTMGSETISHHLSDHVIVCGLGHVGYRVVRLLEQLGERGVVITQQMHREWCPSSLSQFVVLQGDACQETLLRQAGIERAKAILVVTDNDLANISIALDARRLNAKIAVTVRLFDQDLAAPLEEAVYVDRALSTSALATPAFMAAALGASVQGTFEADGLDWILQEVEIPVEASAAGWTIGDWAERRETAPLDLRRGEETLLMPAGTVALQPGDRLTCLGPAKGQNAPFAASAHDQELSTRSSRAAAVWAAVRAWWRETPVALRVTLLTLLVIVVFSVGVFHTALDLPFPDALYFVVTTVTTVG